MTPARRTVVAVVAVIVVFAGAWAVLMSVRLAPANDTDVPLYLSYGAAMRDGQVPYRDFSVEYPPVALVAFAAPALASTHERGYRIAFEILMAALACGVLAGVAVCARRLGDSIIAPTVFAGAAILALGPVTLGHFDLWPVLLVEAALAALLWERRRWAAVLLGLGVAAKLYPVVLLPLGAAWVWRRHGRRAAITWTGIAVAVIVVCFLPFFVLAPHGVVSSVTNQASRPLQLESSAAAALLALHQVASLSIGVEFSHASVNLGGTTATVAAAAATVIEVAALLAVWILFARRPVGGHRLLTATSAAVLTFVVLGKVFSPQFLLWLVPLVPLIGGAAAVGGSAALGVAVLLTRLYFPSRWIDLIRFEAVPTWLLVTRDVVLLGLLAGLLARLSASLRRHPTSPALRDAGSSKAQPALPR